MIWNKKLKKKNSYEKYTDFFEVKRRYTRGRYIHYKLKKLIVGMCKLIKHKLRL